MPEVRRARFGTLHGARPRPALLGGGRLIIRAGRIRETVARRRLSIFPGVISCA